SMLLQEPTLKVETLIDEFKIWCNAFPGSIVDSVSLVSNHSKSSGRPFKHGVITFLQHGDEWGTLPVVLDLLPWLKSALSQALSHTQITLILGNPEAAVICDRGVDYDLNR